MGGGKWLVEGCRPAAGEPRWPKADAGVGQEQSRHPGAGALDLEDALGEPKEKGRMASGDEQGSCTEGAEQGWHADIGPWTAAPSEIWRAQGIGATGSHARFQGKENNDLGTWWR